MEEADCLTVVLNGIYTLTEHRLWSSLPFERKVGDRKIRENVFDEQTWKENIAVGVKYSRDRRTGEGKGTAFVAFRNREDRDVAIALWHGLEIADSYGNVNVLKATVAHRELYLNIGEQRGDLQARPGNRALEVEHKLREVDDYAARKRDEEDRQVSANMRREAQQRAAIDHGRRRKYGEQYEESRSTAASMAPVAYRAMQLSGRCHFCNRIGHIKDECPEYRRLGRTHVCDRCGRTGHMASACYDQWTSGEHRRGQSYP